MSTQITPLQPSATNEWDTADQLGGGIPSDTQRSSSWDDAGASAPADLVNGKNPSLEIEEKSEGLPTGGHEDGQPVDSGEVFQSLSQRRFIRDEYLERVQNFCDQAQEGAMEALSVALKVTPGEDARKWLKVAEDALHLGTVLSYGSLLRCSHSTTVSLRLLLLPLLLLMPVLILRRRNTTRAALIFDGTKIAIIVISITSTVTVTVTIIIIIVIIIIIIIIKASTPAVILNISSTIIVIGRERPPRLAPWASGPDRTRSVASFQFVMIQMPSPDRPQNPYRVVCKRVLHTNIHAHFAQRVPRAHELHHIGGNALVASFPFDDPDALAWRALFYLITHIWKASDFKKPAAIPLQCRMRACPAYHCSIWPPDEPLFCFMTRASEASVFLKPATKSYALEYASVRACPPNLMFNMATLHNLSFVTPAGRRTHGGCWGATMFRAARPFSNLRSDKQWYSFRALPAKKPTQISEWFQARRAAGLERAAAHVKALALTSYSSPVLGRKLLTAIFHALWQFSRLACSTAGTDEGHGSFQADSNGHGIKLMVMAVGGDAAADDDDDDEEEHALTCAGGGNGHCYEDENRLVPWVINLPSNQETSAMTWVSKCLAMVAMAFMTRGEDLEERALHQDDQCTGEQCALNALQHRGAKIATEAVEAEELQAEDEVEDMVDTEEDLGVNYTELMEYGCFAKPSNMRLSWRASGRDFFQQFTFVTQDDTHGAHKYLNFHDAVRHGVIGATNHGSVFMKIGGIEPTGEWIAPYKRHSVMIHSNYAWHPQDGFLVVMKYNHVPWGPSIWPAFWLMNSDKVWPDGGEFDIMEFANDEIPSTLNGATGIAISGDHAYVTAEYDAGITILNIADPSNPSLVGSIADPQLSSAVGIAISGDKAFVSSFLNGLSVVDIADRGNPTITSSLYNGTLLHGAFDVKVVGDYAYVSASFSNCFTVIDISDVSNLRIAGWIKDATVLGYVRGMDVVGDYAYVTVQDFDRLAVINITDPRNPAVAGVLQSPLLDAATDVAVVGNFAYVSAVRWGSTPGITVVNIADPSNLTIESAIFDSDLFCTISGISVAGNYAYAVGCQNKIAVVDITNPTSPSIHSNITSYSDQRKIAVAGDLACITSGEDDGLVVVSISNPSNLSISSFYSDLAFGFLEQAEFIAVSGDYAYVTGEAGSLAAMDISNPTSPRLHGAVHDTEKLDGAEGLAIAGNYAYVAANDYDGLVAVDISNPSNPTIVGFVQDDDKFDGATDVAIAGHYAFVTAYEEDRVTVVDISDPSNLSVVSFLEDDSLDGAEQIVIVGDYAYVSAYSEDSLTVLDIADPRNLTIAGTIKDSRLDGVRGLQVVGDWVFMACYREHGVASINIADPSNMSIAHFLRDDDHLDDARQLQVVGNYAYVTTNDHDGLAVVDISDPYNLTVVEFTESLPHFEGSRGIAIVGGYALIVAHDTDMLTVVSILTTTTTTTSLVTVTATTETATTLTATTMTASMVTATTTETTTETLTATSQTATATATMSVTTVATDNLDTSRAVQFGGALTFQAVSASKITFHTDKNCLLDPRKVGSCMRGKRMGGSGPMNCNTNYWKNLFGCRPRQVQRTGEWFAKNPGAFAASWDEDGITVYHIPNHEIPADLKEDKPRPESWGKWVVAYLPYVSHTCHRDLAGPQEIVLNIALCGDWAGNAWFRSGSARSTGFTHGCRADIGKPYEDCCTKYATSHDGRIEHMFRNQAYFDIDYMKVYTSSGARSPSLSGIHRRGGQPLNA
ncbi:hypothetical protein AK812_SmicGene33274 [Symbiodinium microadriaticum]|uniref:Uncharacterized protein n=1 Tax=Symbiodinium microadriaticum TaxID=2951 RepID=A0A1Q9CS16_SYMMI|nr:hypothetical protein AK812_SmicGene33274 [Symbiodinium microadriaticum]